MTDFDTVILAGEGSVIISHGDPGLVIEIDDNLAQYLVTEMQASELRISTADGIDIDPSSAPVYRVTMPALAAVELTGAGEIRTSGWDSTDVTVRLSGVGDITLEDLTAESLTVDLTGVGRLTASGAAGDQLVTVGGLAEYDGSDLESRTAEVACADNGTAIVWATDALDVEIEGAGSVSYYGDPALTRMIDAAGSLISLGDR